MKGVCIYLYTAITTAYALLDIQQKAHKEFSIVYIGEKRDVLLNE